MITHLPVPLASAVFICRPPLETPTGRYLGNVGFQRLLREAPSKPLHRCVDEDAEPVEPSCPEREVAAQLAAYDIVSLAVVDEAGRLLGAITIDDVLDTRAARRLAAGAVGAHRTRRAQLMARERHLSKPKGSRRRPGL